MLRAEDAASGSNFLTGEIHQIAERRIAEGGTVEPFRCRYNMLSSQPMCFNLIGPLQFRPSLAAAFVQAVTGRDVEVEPHGVRLEAAADLRYDGWVVNGDVSTLTAVHHDGSVAVWRHRDGAAVVLPADYLAVHAQLGYATTAHRAQG